MSAKVTAEIQKVYLGPNELKETSNGFGVTNQYTLAGNPKAEKVVTLFGWLKGDMGRDVSETINTEFKGKAVEFSFSIRDSKVNGVDVQGKYMPEERVFEVNKVTTTNLTIDVGFEPEKLRRHMEEYLRNSQVIDKRGKQLPPRLA